MGIRSSVGLAIKRDSYTSLDLVQLGKIKDLIAEADSCVQYDEGFLFVWRSIKWNPEIYQDVKDFCDVLDTLNPDDFRLVCATPEYPSDDSADRGNWYDNPWDLHKYSTCTLEFNN